jgi:hypothetical protein
MSAAFTVADVLAWARTKPADQQYDFTEATQCERSRSSVRKLAVMNWSAFSHLS